MKSVALRSIPKLGWFTWLGDSAVANLLFFEDLHPGQTWTSPQRTISADDVSLFASLTGDHTPLHTASPDPSERLPFGRPIVHGLLGMSIMAGLSSEHPRVSTLALLRVGEWDFLKPIYFGETVHVVTAIESIENYGRRAGRVKWQRRLMSADQQVLQAGHIETIVARRTPLSRELRQELGTDQARSMESTVFPAPRKIPAGNW